MTCGGSRAPVLHIHCLGSSFHNLFVKEQSHGFLVTSCNAALGSKSGCRMCYSLVVIDLKSLRPTAFIRQYMSASFFSRKPGFLFLPTSAKSFVLHLCVF